MLQALLPLLSLLIKEASVGASPTSLLVSMVLREELIHRNGTSIAGNEGQVLQTVRTGAEVVSLVLVADHMDAKSVTRSHSLATEVAGGRRHLQVKGFIVKQRRVPSRVVPLAADEGTVEAALTVAHRLAYLVVELLTQSSRSPSWHSAKDDDKESEAGTGMVVGEKRRLQQQQLAIRRQSRRDA